MPTEVTTHHLELTDPDQFRPAATGPAYELRQVARPIPELNRFLYSTVGAAWFWYERLSWSRDRWLAFLDRPEVATWVAYVDGSPAGYFELEDQPGDSVEICYFGLLPAFIDVDRTTRARTRCSARSVCAHPSRRSDAPPGRACSLSRGTVGIGSFDVRGGRIPGASSCGLTLRR